MSGHREKAPSASQGERSQKNPDLDLGLLGPRTECVSLCCEAMRSGYCVMAAQAKMLRKAGRQNLYAGFSSSRGVLPGLKQEAGKYIIPSYRSLLPSEVISGLATKAKTSGKSIFCRRSAKPAGWVAWSKPHSLDVPASLAAHLEPRAASVSGGGAGAGGEGLGFPSGQGCFVTFRRGKQGCRKQGVLAASQALEGNWLQSPLPAPPACPQATCFPRLRLGFLTVK